MRKIKTKLQANLSAEAPKAALAKWNPTIRAAKKKDEYAIDIYDQIGENWYGTGITATSISAALKAADGGDVVVNINSPGGDFFEGLAIHSLLKEYEGNVTVKVLGMAASAASVIALAGGEIFIAEHAFFMIHNAWLIAMGNKDDLRDVSDMLEQFDESMVALYASKTGIAENDVRDMMDTETWINGKDAVEKGFADNILGEKDVVESKDNTEYNSALRQLDTALAKSGMPRTERRALIKQVSSTPSATEITAKPSAGEELTKALEGLLNTVKT